MPQGISMRLNVATAFDCPFDGPVAAHTTLALIDKLVSIFPGAEVCPCDTTGRVTPDRVHGMLSSIRDRFPALRNIAYHGHDTYGLRSEEHTSETPVTNAHLVCRLLLAKQKPT